MRITRLALVCLLATVSFACAGPSGGAFSVAVLPDTQNAIDYTHQEAHGFPFDASELFLAQMEWIAGQAPSRGGDVAFVAAVGDVWQHQSETMDPEHAARGFERIPNRWFDEELEATPQTAAIELPTARAGYASLASAGIPFGVAPGNHDYDAMWSDSRYPPVDDAKKIRSFDAETLGMLHVGGLDNFRSVFGDDSEFFGGKPWYVASRNGGTSSAQTFTAGGYTFLHLAIEMAFGDDVLAWASEVIAAHPGLPTIVTTHDYLNAAGERRANPIVDLARVDPQDRDAETLWRELIAVHDQVFLVLCGHHHGVATRVDENAAGHPVIQLLADYQDRGQTSLDAGVPKNRLGRPVGIGDGWLRMLHFDTASDPPLLRVRTYSPHYDTWAEEHAVYAEWYKPGERPDLDDADFVALDAFELPLEGFRARFGNPR